MVYWDSVMKAVCGGKQMSRELIWNTIVGRCFDATINDATC